MAQKRQNRFLTYTQQLDNLAENKNLIIYDKEYALSKLKDICYYSLISGYKTLFYNLTTRKYESVITFSDIVALYNFDKKLRGLLFQNICTIEQKIRSLISYNFCETYSESQSDYLNPNNYNNTAQN